MNQATVVSTYQSLFVDLFDLARQCGNAQEDLTAARLERTAIQRKLDEAEFTMIEIAGGYKALGSNDGERKLTLERLKSNSRAFSSMARELYSADATIVRAQDAVDRLTRQFAAAGYAARLHAGLMAYLAAAGAVTGPNGDVRFMDGSRNGTERQTQAAIAAVTPDDARSIGL